MEHTPEQKPARVLLVDDDDGIREMLDLVLQRNGLQVVQARDGNEALRLYKEQEFDLVITDLIMPDKEGIETILEIRAMKRPIRIMAISGGGRVDQSMHLHLAKSVGADRVLAKPFLPKDFLQVVDELLAAPPRISTRGDA
ncbi:MAG TPA: response regulator [Opitutaceae bacterium]